MIPVKQAAIAPLSPLRIKKLCDRNLKNLQTFDLFEGNFASEGKGHFLHISSSATDSYYILMVLFSGGNVTFNTLNPQACDHFRMSGSS